MTDSKNFIIPVSDWGKLTRAFGEKGVPVPFVKEIFLLESEVAGTGFVDGIEAKTKSLKRGDMLTFQREPKNKYDALAIQVLNGKNERIGYVPRTDNEILSRLMDAGKLLFGRVRKKHVSCGWVHIDIKIFMRDL